MVYFDGWRKAKCAVLREDMTLYNDLSKILYAAKNSDELLEYMWCSKYIYILKNYNRKILLSQYLVNNKIETNLISEGEVWEKRRMMENSENSK